MTLERIVSLCILLIVFVCKTQGQPRVDSIKWMRSEIMTSEMKHKRHSFFEIDSSYIEPQHYNLTFMMQNTNTYEVYRLSNSQQQSITFAPETAVKVGPYFGWRWAVLGYTLDIRHLSLKSDSRRRKEYNLSFYSSVMGLDIYFRKTGNDYKIRNIYLGEDVDTQPLRGADFSGLSSSIKGFNLYYIINHRKFSYPAAFSQSTVQRRSAGSMLLGIGYTRHKLSMNWVEMGRLIDRHLQLPQEVTRLDTTLRSTTVRYTDISLSAGYAYNWVFAHNWLLAGSLSLGLSYKETTGDMEHRRLSFREFTLSNLSLDGIGRFGIVWNNTRWYAGASTILHAYNYRRKQFSTNNFFGSINVYVGVNFIRKGNQNKRKNDS